MKVKLQTPITLEMTLKGPKAERKIIGILDTGARYTVISWQVLEDLGYEPARLATKASIITANGVIQVPQLKVNEVSLGEVKLKNVDVVALDVPELAGIEGLLGLSFLEKMMTKIDYKNKTLEIEDP